ncbi:MAG: ATP-binding protein [Bacteroidales bacterium]|nr:ATP-binding protein [Bacteroidales bacterium]
MTNEKPYRIAIASGKGGTGKTLLSTNLADYLAQEKAVVLADLDVEEPNDALFFKAEIQQSEIQYKMIPDWQAETCTLCGDCVKYCKFNAIIKIGEYITVFNELCHSCYACSELCPAQALPMKPNRIGITNAIKSGRIQLVESRLDIGQEQAVPLIHDTQKYIQDHFSPIAIQLFDCPPGTSCPVIAAVADADFVLLVSEPTPFGLHDLKLAVETMQLLGKAYAVVINRADLGTNELENWCQQEQIPIAARIPFDRDIATTYATGELAWRSNSNLEKALKSLVEYLHERKEVYA